jgi:hypothetical protein
LRCGGNADRACAFEGRIATAEVFEPDAGESSLPASDGQRRIYLISPILDAYGRENLRLEGDAQVQGLRVRAETLVPPVWKGEDFRICPEAWDAYLSPQSSRPMCLRTSRPIPNAELGVFISWYGTRKATIVF